MRVFSLIVLAFSIAAGFNAMLAQKTPPEQVVFTAKTGNVTFNHTAHVKRANNDCQTCHDKLFPESRAPINFKAGLHKTAETAKTSCGGCHNPGGAAFESKGNCAKCHVKG
ncbi:MAG: c(7)-type cytochrome triheme domain-containing protein [Bryobacteraceae bacterium]|jgi:c(7)-type cytochrome triheme protein